MVTAFREVSFAVDHGSERFKGAFFELNCEASRFVGRSVV